MWIFHFDTCTTICNYLSYCELTRSDVLREDYSQFPDLQETHVISPNFQRRCKSIQRLTCWGELLMNRRPPG